ncbi:MAG TPA: hypothetical protein DIC53_08025 [Synergistaceae bacterium]|nr:hypothetical protein [Synergistaceae bacterium]
MNRFRRRRAFTLVEILLSVIILGLVMAAILPLFFSVLSSYEFHQDIAWAKQRGQIAVASIQPMALAAGLGMPNRTSDLQKAFIGLDAVVPSDETKRFRQTVQLASGDVVVPNNATEGSELWLLYSVPSGCGVNFERHVPENGTVTLRRSDKEIENIDALDGSVQVGKGAFAGWLAFPGSLSPLSVSGIDTGAGVLSLASELDTTIRAFDEAHYVRGAKIGVRNGRLEVNRLDRTGDQPVVEGIYGMRCTYDPEGDRVLTVRILARGIVRRDGILTSDVDGWGDIGALDRHYRYAVVSKSWRVRN